MGSQNGTFLTKICLFFSLEHQTRFKNAIRQNDSLTAILWLLHTAQNLLLQTSFLSLV